MTFLFTARVWNEVRRCDKNRNLSITDKNRKCAPSLQRTKSKGLDMSTAYYNFDF